MKEVERPALPSSLRAVAWFTILCGIVSLLTVLVELFHRKLFLNFGVLLIPAGFGLLRRDRGWRTFTLFMLWLGMIGFGAGFVALLLGFGRPTSSAFRVFGLAGNREASAIISAAMFGVNFWQYRVLTSPPVRRWFGLTSGPGAPPGDPGTGSGPGGSGSGPLPGT
jgi:hypothetical protein